MKEFAKKFYHSKAWLSCRKAYIAKRVRIDGAVCEICHELPGYILHHKIELNPQNINDPDIALNHCNLQYVCKRCHDDIHLEEFRPPTGILFSSDGRIIPPKR